MAEDIPSPFNPPSYQKVWKDSERKDLLSPREVKIEHEGDRESIPFLVSIDKEEVTNFMRLEGTTSGDALNIKLVYNEGPIRKRVEMFPREESFSWDSLSKQVSKHLEIGEPIGSHKEEKGQRTLTINLGTIYDYAVMYSPGSSQNVKEKFKKMSAEIIAHEIGHARQPKDIKRINHNTIMRVVGGTLVLIDAGRRTMLPWAGIAEPLVIGGEIVAAAAITQEAVYKRTPSEKFAREYASSASKQWEKMLKVSIRSEEQLRRDYFWDKLLQSPKKALGNLRKK